MRLIKGWSWVFTGIGMLAVSGCAVVTSVPHRGPLDSIERLNSDGQGIVYNLPKRHLRLRIQRTPQPTDIQQQLASAEQALADMQARLVVAQGERRGAGSLAAKLEDSGNIKAIEEARADVAKAQARESLATEARDRAQQQVVSLRAAVAEAESAGECPVLQYNVVLTLLPPVPDPDQVYIAKLGHSPFRDDALKISTTAEGLLTTSNIKATDRTADIIVDLAGAIAGLVRPVPARIETEQVRVTEPTCPKPLTFEKVFDPTVPGAGDVNGELRALDIPYAVDWMALGEVATQSTRPLAGDKIKGFLYRRPVPYVFTIYGEHEPMANHNGNGDDGGNGEADPMPTPCDPPAPAKNCTPIQSAMVLLPNGGPLGVVPVNASPFVETVYDVTFDQGMVTSWDAQRPSELASVVRIPVAVLKAIVSIPAELIQLRVNLTSSERELLEAQKALLDAVKALEEARAAPQPADTVPAPEVLQ